jgi:hypothetical protein
MVPNVEGLAWSTHLLRAAHHAVGSANLVPVAASRSPRHADGAKGRVDGRVEEVRMWLAVVVVFGVCVGLCLVWLASR